MKRERLIEWEGRIRHAFHLAEHKAPPGLLDKLKAELEAYADEVAQANGIASSERIGGHDDKPDPNDPPGDDGEGGDGGGE